MKGSGVLAIVAVFLQMLCHRSSKKLECSKNNVFTLVKIIQDNETKHYLYIPLYNILIQHYQRNKTYNEIYTLLNEMKS